MSDKIICVLVIFYMWCESVHLISVFLICLLHYLLFLLACFLACLLTVTDLLTYSLTCLPACLRTYCTTLLACLFAFLLVCVSLLPSLRPCLLRLACLLPSFKLKTNLQFCFLFRQRYIHSEDRWNLSWSTVPCVSVDFQLYRLLQENTQPRSAWDGSSRHRQLCSCRRRQRERNNRSLNFYLLRIMSFCETVWICFVTSQLRSFDATFVRF